MGDCCMMASGGLACICHRGPAISRGRVNANMCNHCGMNCTPEGHDACLGTLPHPVMNACCGHGDPAKAYIQIYHEEYQSDPNALRLDGMEAVAYINRLKDGE